MPNDPANPTSVQISPTPTASEGRAARNAVFNFDDLNKRRKPGGASTQRTTSSAAPSASARHGLVARNNSTPKRRGRITPHPTVKRATTAAVSTNASSAGVNHLL